MVALLQESVASWMKDWLPVTFPMVNLAVIIFGVFKVFNRQEDEWRERERRLLSIEGEMANFRRLMNDMTGITIRLGEISSEMIRMRDRLDKFLDLRVTTDEG